jgi:hypothetical protein
MIERISSRCVIAVTAEKLHWSNCARADLYSRVRVGGSPMPAIDLHALLGEGLTSPYDNAAEVTPSDTVDLTYVTRALWCAATGTVKVTMLGGETVTIDHGTHTLLTIRVTRVWATGTANTPKIVALW